LSYCKFRSEYSRSVEVAMALAADAPRTRLCHLMKSSVDQEYGFNLHAEAGKGQYIGSVDYNSPADNAGLCRGDRIVAVNGVYVADQPHKDVVAKIKEDPLQCRLTVIDEAGELWYRERNLTVPLQDEIEDNAVLEQKPLPRLCTLVRSNVNQEYGFNLHADRGRGHFIGKVDVGSIAERAGLEQGQRIVGVNNTLIYVSSSHKDVVRLIKQDPSGVQLLVASPSVDDWYRSNGVEFSFTETETWLPSVVTSEQRKDNNNGYVTTTEGDDQIDGKFKMEITKTATPMTEPEQRKISLENVNDQQFGAESANGSSFSSHYVSQESQSSRDGLGDLWDLTAAEMRQRLLRQKKVDPRSQPLSLEKKYEIAQNL
ncbi:Na(+)/H(+) exchange regulatory cofactor NHE-RF2, partial [Trichinella pseudospiralis]